LGGNIDEIISLVLGENLTDENLESVKETYLNYYNSSKKENTVPFDNTEEILKELQNENILLSINSNRLDYSLNEFVDRYFGDIDFIAIEGQDYTHPSKPHPYGVNRIIEKADVNVDEAIYIGDSSTDIKTAQNAGMDCLIVSWGYGSQEDLENEYVLDVIDNLSEIINYF
jgi:phosphoglycolate phosphatase